MRTEFEEGIERQIGGVGRASVRYLTEQKAVFDSAQSRDEIPAFGDAVHLGRKMREDVT